MIMAALVVSSSTAGSFSFFQSAPPAADIEDFDADQSRERSADRSRPSRDRVNKVDSARRASPQPPQKTRQPEKPASAPPPNNAATVAAPKAPGP
jgi:hypothetical protein